MHVPIRNWGACVLAATASVAAFAQIARPVPPPPVVPSPPAVTPDPGPAGASQPPATATLAPPPLGPTARTVQIVRTTHGIAHIVAPDYEALGYGVAYAHAQDNVCQTADALVTVRGERSRFFGSTATGLFGLRPVPNDQSDAYVRAQMDDDALALVNANASNDAKALGRGYVAGYNRFLVDNAERIPAACKGQPWLRPMTLADYRRLNELRLTQLGIAALAGGIVGAQPPRVGATAGSENVTAIAGNGPPDARKLASARHANAQARPGAVGAAAAPAAADVRAALAELGLDAPALGSNGWAFGADVTDNGRGIVLGNPHFPWFGPNRFWEVHLTIPGKLDVMGAAIGNAPVVVIGFNKDVAWTHTVSTGRRFTLFELTLVPGDPTSYVVDGKREKMRATRVRFEVRGADGQSAAREATIWSSRWGPLVVVPRLGLHWTATTAYAVKDALGGNGRHTDAWIGIDTARTVGDIRTAISGLGLPFVNTIAADRNGVAFYADYSTTPDVDAELMQRCAPSREAAGLFASSGIVVLNGAKSDCDWKRDPASPVPGLMAPSRMPALARSDWVQNSNDSYWLTNPAEKLTGFSPVLGAVGVPQGLRTRSGISEIDQSRRDPAGGARKIGMADVESMVLADRNYAASLVLDDLLAACGEAPTAETREACAVLGRWDRTNSLGARGAHLFTDWWVPARSIPNVWRVPFSASDPLRTPAGLNMKDDAVRAKVWEALGAAATAIKTAGMAIDAPLGQVLGVTTKIGRIPLHGGTNPEGVLNIVESDAVPAMRKGGYAPPTHGTSYLQVVGFDDDGPVADALLTYGQSSQPDAQWSYDQLSLFSRKQWVRLPFRPEDIARQRSVEPIVLDVP
jgi:acyl-homoserine-lactone acylase